VHYPVTFEMDFVERRSRLTTFLRWLLAIPHFLFLFAYGIAWYVVAVIAWFALLFTGRWPESLYRFSCNFLRYGARLAGYLYLCVDPYPPFSGAEDDSYPVRVRFDPPLARYSRLKVFFRPLYTIGAYVIRYALGIILTFVSFISWVVITVTGRQPAPLQEALRFSLSYTVRADALLFLITETYPPLTEETGHAVSGGPMPPAVPTA
jgi:hypothetical protein